MKENAPNSKVEFNLADAATLAALKKIFLRGTMWSLQAYNKSHTRFLNLLPYG